NDVGPGNQLVQHFHALRPEPVAEERHARQVAARPAETGDEAADWIAADHEHDGDSRGSATGYLHRWPVTHDNRRLATSQVSCQSPQRCSIFTFWPSTKPVSFRPWRNAATMCVNGLAGVLRKKPTTGIVGCCARAPSGQIAAAAPNTVMKSRRLNACPRGSGRDIVTVRLRAVKGCPTSALVRSGHFAEPGRCPLFHQKQTFADAIRTSV